LFWEILDGIGDEISNDIIRRAGARWSYFWYALKKTHSKVTACVFIKARDHKQIIMSASATLKQRKEDEETIIKYVKNDMFPIVKFIYDEKIDLIVDGDIYKDFKEKCKGSLGGRLINEQNLNTYMESAWTTAMAAHVQQTAIVQKRSAVYTVMQNKFSGKQCKTDQM
jgi:hypothetical protein